jgi:hypothetical protein
VADVRLLIERSRDPESPDADRARERRDTHIPSQADS